MSTQDRVRLMLWTWERDGGPDSQPGIPPTRWRQRYEEVRKPQQPDWLGMAELKYSQTRPDAPPAEKRATQRAASMPRSGSSVCGASAPQ